MIILIMVAMDMSEIHTMEVGRMASETGVSLTWNPIAMHNARIRGKIASMIRDGRRICPVQ